MFYIDKTTHKIILTKGDNAEIIVSIKDANGEDREVYGDDVITLTVRKSVNSAIAVSKTAERGIISFTPDDTNRLPSGSYVYDVQLKTGAGKIYTIIPKSSFILFSQATSPHQFTLINPGLVLAISVIFFNSKSNLVSRANSSAISFMDLEEQQYRFIILISNKP